MKVGSILAAALSLIAVANAAVVRPTPTKTALVNPGMGWVYYQFSNRLWAYGGLTDQGDTLKWFPGVSTIYLRVPWCVLEPEEGEFRWDLLDSYAQPFIDRGLRVALRVTCCESRYRYATPEWVRNAGAKGIFYRMPKSAGLKGWAADDVELWEPDYTDPIYLSKLENFLKAMALRYDGNPSVDFIDIGTFGMWGEGHTACTSRLPREKADEVMSLHMRLHRRLFPRSYLVVSDDVAGGRNPEPDALLMKLARELNIGFRDDSILVYVPDAKKGLDSWFHADWAKRFEAAGLPVVVECEHYDLSVDRGAWSCEKLLAAVEAYQASWISLHGWPRRFYEGNRDVIDSINLRLGYRLELCEAKWPDVAALGERIEISSTWANVGVARCHVGGNICWSLIDDAGNLCWTSVDASWNVNELQPAAKVGEKHLVDRVSACRFGHVHEIPEINDAVLVNSRQHGVVMKGLCPTLRQGVYLLCVSVGRNDATPVLELPLKGGIGKRYPLGKIEIR